VINPYLFKEYAKRMLVTFINVANYGGLKDEDVQRQGFECYSVLGHYDMMVSHLHQDPNDLFFGIREMMSWNAPSQRIEQTQIADGDDSMYQYFEVFNYHKVLGVQVMPAHKAAFRDGPPTSEELAQILALGRNWNDENFTDDTREMLLDRKWIIGSTTREPGNIDAVMTIYLDHPEELRIAIQKFEDYVLPSLLANSSITSIYEGTGRKLSVHYLLRITGSKDNLFAFIQEVHRLAAEARLMIMTNTFVIVKKWSRLDMEKTFLIIVLPSHEEAYRNHHILDKLTVEEKVKFIQMDRDYQLTFIDTYRYFESKLHQLVQHLPLNQQLPDILRDLVIGLFGENFSILRHPHDELQGHVEAYIREHVGGLISSARYDEIRERAGVQKGKSKDRLTYAEWLLIAIYCAENGLLDSNMLVDLQSLKDDTVHVRNAIKHDEWSRLSIKIYVAALKAYIGFLLRRPAKPNTP
jgi:hypothetical protein